MDRYITLADLTQHFKDYHTALVEAKIGDIPSLSEFFKDADGTTPLTVADGMKKVYNICRESFTLTDTCDHDTWVTNYKGEAPEAGDDFKAKLYYITDQWTEADGTTYQKGSLIIGYKSKTNADATLSYEWLYVPAEGNTIGDTSALNVKLKAEDTADDGKVTLVKASNLAYTRSVVTVDDTITNTVKNQAEYKFQQDGATVCTVVIPKDVYVSGAEVITADGSEVIGVNPADNSDLHATADRKYLRIDFANSDAKVYVDFDSLFNKAQLNATQVQLAIDTDQTISASIVAGSVTPTELNTLLNKEINFIGYDDTLNDTTPAGDQLTTTAQTLREAVNEHDAEIGDLSTFLGRLVGSTTLVGAINKIMDLTGDPWDLSPSGPYNLVTGINAAYSEGKRANTNIGTLSWLNTTDKTDLVAAINEIWTSQLDLGKLADLTTTDKSKAVAAINEVNAIALAALHIIAKTDNADFIATYQTSSTIKQHDIVIITDDFTVDGVDYKAGTWAYYYGGAWHYMNNGGGGDAIVLEGTGVTPPTVNTASQIAAIKDDKIYVFTDGNGNKASYIYVKNSDDDATQNYWLQLSSGVSGIEWVGTYNYVATTTVTDPVTGEKTENVVPWEATSSQLAGMTTWYYNEYGENPSENRLCTLNVDSAYYGQYLYKNGTWSEYSSLTKATKAQYGVSKFATKADYEAGTVTVNADGTTTPDADVKANLAIDPWLLRQILAHVATDDNIYTKAQMDTMLALKADDTDLTNYYDKSQTDAKLKALQKAYVVNTDPASMSATVLEQYYGSLIYYVDGSGSTKTYICDSTGVLEDLGTSGVSLTGYVETTDAKYQTLSDIKLTDSTGAALTVQKQLDAKQDKVTGAATTITTANLTQNRVLISNTSGKVATSVILASELAMLDDIDTTGDTIETRLQNLEAGGGGGTGQNMIFVTALPTADIDVKAIYRRTSDNTYWIYDNANWHRIDYDADAHKINGNSVDETSTSESLDIVRSLTTAEYSALSSAEKNNGTLYCITDDGGSTSGGSSSSSTAAAGVSSINGYTGAVTLKQISVDGGAAQSLIGSGTIAITTTGSSGTAATAASVSYTAPTGAASTGANLQAVIDQLQARIAALEAAMPSFTLTGSSLSITTP